MAAVGPLCRKTRSALPKRSPFSASLPRPLPAPLLPPRGPHLSGCRCFLGQSFLVPGDTVGHRPSETPSLVLCASPFPGILFSLSFRANLFPESTPPRPLSWEKVRVTNPKLPPRRDRSVVGCSGPGAPTPTPRPGPRASRAVPPAASDLGPERVGDAQSATCVCSGVPCACVRRVQGQGRGAPPERLCERTRDPNVTSVRRCHLVQRRGRPTSPGRAAGPAAGAPGGLGFPTCPQLPAACCAHGVPESVASFPTPSARRPPGTFGTQERSSPPVSSLSPAAMLGPLHSVSSSPAGPSLHVRSWPCPPLSSPARSEASSSCYPPWTQNRFPPFPSAAAWVPLAPPSSPTVTVAPRRPEASCPACGCSHHRPCPPGSPRGPAQARLTPAPVPPSRLGLRVLL